MPHRRAAVRTRATVGFEAFGMVRHEIRRYAGHH
jgi:hypothetical protein